MKGSEISTYTQASALHEVLPGRPTYTTNPLLPPPPPGLALCHSTYHLRIHSVIYLFTAFCYRLSPVAPTQEEKLKKEYKLYEGRDFSYDAH